MPGKHVTTLFFMLFPSSKKSNAAMENGEKDVCMQKEARVEATYRNKCVVPCCALLLLVFATVVCVNLYLLTFILRLQQKQLCMMRKIDTFEKKPIGCLPCQHIRLHPAEDRQNFRLLHVDSVKDECCAKDSKQLGILLDLSFERKYRIAKANGTFDVPKIVYVDASNGTKYLSNNKPSAHLMASYDKNLKHGTAGQEVPLMIRKWNYNKDIAFVTDGLEYRHGRLIVHKEGTYYIYSNVAFLKYYMNKNERALSDHAIMHIIARYNIIYPNGGEERLFEASLSQCWAKDKRYGEYVSHLGGVLRLNKGDELYVKVRDLRSLVQRPKATYFGIYMI